MNPAPDDTRCLERMCDLFSEREDWLVDQVVARVREQSLPRIPRTEESWRESIRGLSDVIFQATYVRSMSTAERSALDPILAFGVIRARTHQRRGVHPDDWTRLLRVYRQAYTELLHEGGFDEFDLATCRAFVAEVFDRFEAGFHQEYRLRALAAE